MKKSLRILLAALLIGSTFTSCIESTIPDEAVVIYDAQANLLAAEAALLAAEASQAAADAALATAMTAYQASLTEAQSIANALAQASNAILLAQAEAALQATIAQTTANIATQEAELAALIAANDIANDVAIAELEAQLSANAVILAENQAALQVLAATTATQVAQLEAQLDATLAAAITDAANATNALVLAQAQFDAQVRQLQDQMAAMDDAEFNRYVNLYEIAYGMLNTAQTNEINKRVEIIAKVRDMAIIEENATMFIAGLNADLTAANAEKADLEVAKTELEASIAAGTNVGDNEATRAALQEEIDANLVAISNLMILQEAQMADKAVVDAALAELQDEIDDLATLNVARFTAVQDLNALNADLENNLHDIDDNNDAIAALETINADFDAARAALVTAIADAEADVVTAQAALVAAQTAEDAAETADGDAADALVVANAAVIAAITEFNRLSVDVQSSEVQTSDAAVLLENLLSQEEALTVAVTDANDAVDAALIEYNTAKALFDADPSGTATDDPGADGVFGEGALNEARYVTFGPDGALTGTIQYAISDFPPAAPGSTFGGATGATANNIVASGTPFADLVNEYVVDAINYYDVAADDTNILALFTNLVRFENATLALGMARDAQISANQAIATFGPALIAAQENYDTLSEAFATVLADIDAQKIVLADAETAAAAAAAFAAAANVAYVATQDATTDADAALTAAQNAVTNAENDLDAFDLPSNSIAANIQSIEQLEADIAQLVIDNAALALEITAQEALVAEILAKLDAGKTPEMVAAEEAVIEAGMTLMETQASIIALQSTNTSLANIRNVLVMAINGEIDSVQMEIDMVDAQIMTADDNIAMIEAAIVTASSPSLTDIERDEINILRLAKLEADLVEIQQDITFYTALTTKYKDIVDSLL
jgi:chromosome segregation ATPase